MRSLDHSSIIKFYEAWIDQSEQLNIVMEYAPGGDLYQKLKALKKKE